MPKTKPHYSVRVVTHLSPRVYKLFIAHCRAKRCCKSTALERMTEFCIKTYYTEFQQAELLRVFDMMSEQQKKAPHVTEDDAC